MQKEFSIGHARIGSKQSIGQPCARLLCQRFRFRSDCGGRIQNRKGDMQGLRFAAAEENIF
jgi:hypothetical protein